MASASQHPPIQIVDDSDRPVGGASMTDAYSKGLIHRVVFILVEDPSGRILLQKRSLNVATYPNCWDISAAGHVDEGETYLQAAKRELAEEIGVTGFKLEQIAIFREDLRLGDRLLKRFNGVYRTTIPADTPLTPQLSEVLALEWFSFDETKRLIKERPDEVANGLILSLEAIFSS